jgi:hypothetical protein
MGLRSTRADHDPSARRASARRALLGPERFAAVLEPLLGRKVGYVRPAGHVGGSLIELATAQLFRLHGVRWVPLDLDRPANVDVIVFGGGGGMGDRTLVDHAARGRALRLGPPVVILPQSFTDREDRPFARVFVRERASLGLRPDALLAPDLALGLAWQPQGPPSRELGILMRRDGQRTGRRLVHASDPATICRSPVEAMALAARYRRIITDRLHCAIAGLHAGREVTLLPNNTHKNRSMHETWLADLGCRFAESVEAALLRRVAEAREDRPAA